MKKKNNKFLSEIAKFGLIFIPINWVICAIVTPILWVKVSESWGMGYLLGSLTSFLTFGLHMKDANDYGSEKINIYMKIFTNRGTRLLLSAAVLAIAWFFTNTFNFYATAIGILVLKFILLIFGIIFFFINKKKVEPELEEKVLEEGGEA